MSVVVTVWAGLYAKRMINKKLEEVKAIKDSELSNWKLDDEEEVGDS